MELLPKKWQYVSLEELCLQPFSNGISLSQESLGYGTKLVNIVNLYESYKIDVSKLGRANASSKQIKTAQLQKGDILFVRSSVKREGAAMCAYFPGAEEPTVFGCFNIRFRPNLEKADPEFLTLFLRSSVGRTSLLKNCQTATITNINQEGLSSVRVPLPPIAEQKRIAAIAQKCDRLRRTRRYTQQLSDSYLRSVFLEMFGNLETNSNGWEFCELGDVADIASGVTKGQKFNGRQTVTVPYLRVANVQDGYLNLSEIKKIEALPSEVKKLNLQKGDVLMTEGGDFDKLGRGAIWNGQIENCIHQNHIFRVRTHKDAVLPNFFAFLLLTRFSKLYFLRCSKQTTNLATINMTQLKGLPVPMPPLPL